MHVNDYPSCTPPVSAHPGDTRIRDKGGRITLDARKGNDQIYVNRNASDAYSVTVNGYAYNFSRSDMNRLDIHGGKGNDRIVVDPSVDVPVRVYGDKGNDTIVNHADRSYLNGGKGNDQIYNYSNGTTVRGGRGNDSIQSVGSRNALYGDRGRDTIRSYGWGNYANGGRGRDSVSNQTPWPCVNPRPHCYNDWCEVGRLPWDPMCSAPMPGPSFGSYRGGFSDNGAARTMVWAQWTDARWGGRSYYRSEYGYVAW